MVGLQLIKVEARQSVANGHVTVLSMASLELEFGTGTIPSTYRLSFVLVHEQAQCA